MRIAKRTEAGLRAITYAGLALLYTPLALIFLLSFNVGNSLTWPPQAWSLHWWGPILDVASARQALVSSVRLRRIAPNLREASADLGADGAQTLWHIIWPLVRSAVFAGGILAFALSFDEVVVTTFTAGAGIQTLPQRILNNFSRPNVLPYVTVVATVVMVVSLPVAWLAQYLSDTGAGTGRVR